LFAISPVQQKSPFTSYIFYGTILKRTQKKVININYDSGAVPLEISSSLKGYSLLIAKIRKCINAGQTRDEAIVAAIKSCIKEGILKEFLTENYREVIKMLNYEYDADAEKRVLRQEARQEGCQEGIDLMAKLINEGVPIEDAVKMAKMSVQSGGLGN